MATEGWPTGAFAERLLERALAENPVVRNLHNGTRRSSTVASPCEKRKSLWYSEPDPGPNHEMMF